MVTHSKPIQTEPNQIQRLRNNNFTEKRNPYKQYHKAKWQWLDVFKEIDELRSQNVIEFFNNISDKFGINKTTLKKRYYKWKNNACPTDVKAFVLNDNRGGSNKVFSELEEFELFYYIKDVFIDANLPLCNSIIKSLAIQKWNYIHPNNADEFNASNGWCNVFKQRWNLTTVKLKISRIASRIYTEKEILEFLTECNDAYKEVGKTNFYNMDEMFWNTINASLTTITIKGSESAKIKINGNDKEGFTVVLIVSAGGIMLQPLIIAKGKTSRSLRKFMLNNKIIGTYSNNGWINNGIMLIILDLIRTASKSQKAALLMDQHRSHTSDFIKNEARKRNIILIYVPIGLTYKYQPLDVKINGILKSHAKTLWCNHMTNDPFEEISLSDAITHLISACSIVKSETIAGAFKCCLS